MERDMKQADAGMPRILRAPEVERMTGLSGVSIWRLEKRGEFPRRRRLVGKLVGWRSDDVQRWIESRERLPVEQPGSTD